MTVTTASEQEQQPPQEAADGSADMDAADAGAGLRGVTLVQLVNVVLRHWRVVVLLPLVLAFLVGTWSLLQQRTYTASASFVPQSFQERQSGIATLASQLGFALGRGQANSPLFYADLLRSREILREAAQTRYTFQADTGTVGRTLIDILQVEGVGARRTYLATVRLGDLLSIRTWPTGVVEVSAPASSPALAEQIVARLLELVNDFNLEWRQSQAAQERLFIEGRLEEVRGELVQAETELQRFLQQNRRFENSPELVFQYDRLQRQVNMHQAIVTDLTTAYEEARIAEVRNTPVITLVERPEGSAHPNPRRTVLKVLLALILGTMLGVVYAFGTEFVRGMRASGREDVREFGELRADIVGELRHPLRRLRRRVGTRVRR